MAIPANSGKICAGYISSLWLTFSRNELVLQYIHAYRAMQGPTQHLPGILPYGIHDNITTGDREKGNRLYGIGKVTGNSYTTTPHGSRHIFLKKGYRHSEGYGRSVIYVHSPVCSSNPLSKLDCLGSTNQPHQISVTAHRPVQVGCSGQYGS